MSLTLGSPLVEKLFRLGEMLILVSLGCVMLILFHRSYSLSVVLVMISSLAGAYIFFSKAELKARQELFLSAVKEDRE